MKKLALAAALAVLMGMAAPAHANYGTGSITFKVADAPIPCSQACVYVAPDTSEPPDSLLGTESRACTDPSPAGSYTDGPLMTAPIGATALQVRSTPTIDWDTVVCKKVGATISFVAFEEQQGIPGLDTGDTCPQVAVGCADTVMAAGITRANSTKYFVRAYNFSDAFDLVAKYTWI